MRGHLRVIVFTAALLGSPWVLASGGASAPSGNGMVSSEGTARTRAEAAKQALVSAVRTVNYAKG
jgi:hypothetical protein